MQRERERSIVYAHPETHEFLKAVIEDGAVVRALEEYRASPGKIETRIRDLNILGIYLETPATYREIADIYPRLNNRKVLRQSINRALSSLWSNASDETRSTFPLSEIKIAKPRSLKSRERTSKSLGGESFHVSQLLSEGVTYEEIQEKLELTDSQLTGARRILKNLGQEVPYKFRAPSENKRIAKILETSESDSEIQRALNRVKRKLRQTLAQRENPPFLSVSKAARMAGFHFRVGATSIFVDSLRQSKIPVGQLPHVSKSRHAIKYPTYYFIATQHLERAKEALLQDAHLAGFRENPVKQIAGPDGKIPVTTKLIQGKGYQSPRQLFRQLRINLGRTLIIKYEDFFDENCPVSVFKLRDAYYYPKEKEGELKRYIRERARETGLI